MQSTPLFLVKTVPMGFTAQAGRPRTLRLSCCIGLNPESPFMDPENKDGYYKQLYSAIMQLRNYRLSIGTVKVPQAGPLQKLEIVKTADYPFEFFLEKEFQLVDAKAWDNLRAEVWDGLFPREYIGGVAAERSQAAGSVTEVPERPLKIKGIEPFFNKSEDLFFSGQSNEFFSNFQKRGLQGVLEHIQRSQRPLKEAANRPKPYFTLLEKLRKTSVAYSKAAEQKLHSFLHNNHVSTLGSPEELSIQILGAIKNVDMEEVVNNYIMLYSNPVLARIVGLIQDFEVELTDALIPKQDSSLLFTVAATIKGLTFTDPVSQVLTDNTQTLTTQLQAISKGRKFAYLCAYPEMGIASPVPYQNSFTHSILNGSHATLVSHDDISVEENVVTAVKNLPEDPVNNKVKQQEAFSTIQDAFTRGIIYNYKDLPMLINPVDLADAGVPLTDEHLTHGYRVGVYRDRGQTFASLHSLTARRLSISWNGKNLLTSDNVEGCIHIDSPMTYIDEDGTQKHTATNAVFEYSEGLLLLKSAFSKATRSSESQRYLLEGSAHNAGMEKTRLRFNTILNVYKFPFTEPDADNTKNLVCRYDVPHMMAGNGPRLRFV